GHIPADPMRNAADQLEILCEVAPARNDGRVILTEVDESGVRGGVKIVPAAVPERLSGLVVPAEVHNARVHRAHRGYVPQKIADNLDMLAALRSPILMKLTTCAVHAPERTIIAHLSAHVLR